MADQLMLYVLVVGCAWLLVLFPRGVSRICRQCIMQNGPAACRWQGLEGIGTPLHRMHRAQHLPTRVSPGCCNHPPQQPSSCPPFLLPVSTFLLISLQFPRPPAKLTASLGGFSAVQLVRYKGGSRWRGRRRIEDFVRAP